MKDSKNRGTPSGKETVDENGVVELTPDMEIVSGRVSNIIDLTEVLPPANKGPEDQLLTTEVTDASPESETHTPESVIELRATDEVPAISGIEASADDIVLETEADDRQEVDASIGPPPTEEATSPSIDLEVADAGDTLVLTDMVHPIDLVSDEMPLDEAPAMETPLPTDPGAAAELDKTAEQTAILNDLKFDDTIELNDMVLPMDGSPEPTQFPEDTTGTEDQDSDLDQAAGETLDLTDMINPIDLVAEEHSSENAFEEALTQVETYEPPAASEAPVSGSETASWADLKDDDTIVLTDMVLPSDLVKADTVPTTPADEAAPDDDVLDLTDMVFPDEEAVTEAPTAMALPETDDEEVLDLTDMVLPEEEDVADAETADEEVLELTDKVSPEEQVEMEADDDEVLMLTDMVLADDDTVADIDAASIDGEMAPAPDEEVLELTDRVLPADEGEDAVIELMEIVDAETLAAELTEFEATERADRQEDEEIIELSDMVSSEELAELVTADGPAAQLRVDANDEETIDLLDIVEPQEPQAFEGPAPGGAADQVIQLDSVLAHVRKNRERIVADIALGLEDNLSNDPRDTSGHEPHANLNLDLDEVREAIGETKDLTDMELERVIEQIIRTKYAETIEKAITRAVEKAVTREMEDIKRNLAEDLDLEQDE